MKQVYANDMLTRKMKSAILLLMQVLDIAVVTVLVVSMLVFLGVVVYTGFTRMMKQIQEATAALKEVSKECHEISKAPGYLDGLTKVCGDQLQAMLKLDEATNRLYQSIFGEDGKKKETPGWIGYEDSAADQAYEVEEMVRNGYSRGEATERVKAMAMDQKRREAEQQARERFNLT